MELLPEIAAEALVVTLRRLRFELAFSGRIVLGKARTGMSYSSGFSKLPDRIPYASAAARNSEIFVYPSRSAPLALASLPQTPAGAVAIAVERAKDKALSYKSVDFFLRATSKKLALGSEDEFLKEVKVRAFFRKRRDSDRFLARSTVKRSRQPKMTITLAPHSPRVCKSVGSRKVSAGFGVAVA